MNEPSAPFSMKRLYRDAGSLATSSVANAVLGVVFWALTVRLFPPEELGVMTAVLAVIVSAGGVVAAGVGDAYTALLPAVGAARRRVYRRGQRVWFGLALITGIGFAMPTTLLLTEVHRSSRMGIFGVGVLVAVGILAWSAFLLQNSTLVSLDRARWLPASIVATSLGKIVLLLALAMTLRWHSIELAFVSSAVAIVLALRPAIVRVVDSGKDLPVTATMPEDHATGEFNRLVVRTTAAAMLSFGVLNLTPFFVTAFAGPIQGALFAVALSIVLTLEFVTSALAMSLLFHASSAPEHATTMARTVLIRAATVASVGAVIIVMLAPLALRQLNAQYGAMGATGVIALLSTSCVIGTVYGVWGALQRSRRNMKMLLALDFIAATLLLAVIPGLCQFGGALGGAFALLLFNSVRSAGAIIHFLATRRRRNQDKASTVTRRELV